MNNSGLKVTVSTSKLLEILIKNRATHSSNYSTALNNYYVECREALERRLKEVDNMDPDEVLNFNIDCPVNYLSYYDKAIGMLEMATEGTIEITEQQYESYVMDRWSWSSTYSRLTMSKLL
jgi:hypothetical protein